MSLTPEWQLKPGRFSPVNGPVLTVVMDGVGLGPLDEGNAVHLARTPVLDTLFSHLVLSLNAHGKAVGLLNMDLTIAKWDNAIRCGAPNKAPFSRNRHYKWRSIRGRWRLREKPRAKLAPALHRFIERWQRS